MVGDCLRGSATASSKPFALFEESKTPGSVQSISFDGNAGTVSLKRAGSLSSVRFFVEKADGGATIPPFQYQRAGTVPAGRGKVEPSGY